LEHWSLGQMTKWPAYYSEHA